MGCDKRVIAVAHRDHVAVGHPNRGVAPPGINAVEAVAVRIPIAEIVNLLEVDFARRVVGVVLVRRIRGPVAARREDLAHQQPVRWKRGRHDVDDLPGRVAAAADLVAAVFRPDRPRLQIVGRSIVSGGGPGIGNLARRARDDAERRAGGKVHGVRVAEEHVGARTDPMRSAGPDHLELAAQQHQAALLAARQPGPHRAGGEVAHREMNAIPAQRPRRQVERRCGHARWHACGSIQQSACFHRTKRFGSAPACLP